jgi:hypothetical protein
MLITFIFYRRADVKQTRSLYGTFGELSISKFRFSATRILGSIVMWQHRLDIMNLHI